MGNYKCRRPGMLQAWQMSAAEMMFQGYTDTEIIHELFPKADTPNKVAVKRRLLRDLPKNETFMEYYRSIIQQWTIHSVGPALKKLGEQIDSNQPWLANKAANDILTHSKPVMSGADENTVVVKVEGMPELGTPEDG